MTNILDTDKQRDVLALGRLGWTLRRIQTATGVRRETVAAYLKAAGIVVRAPPAAGGSGQSGVNRPCGPAARHHRVVDLASDRRPRPAGQRARFGTKNTCGSKSSSCLLPVL
jgi:hypothetical protein